MTFKPHFFHISLLHFSGLIAVCLGCAGLAGWIFNIPILIQLHPSFDAMKFNTALMLILSGAGLMSFDTRPAIALVTSAAVFAFSALSYGQYLYHVDLGIDDLFFKAWDNKASPFSTLRISRNSCLTLMLISMAVICLLRSWGQVERIKPFILSMIASVIFAIGMLGLLGYATSGIDSYLRSLSAGMALQTSLIYLLIGGSLFIEALRFSRGSYLWLPIPMFLLLVSLSVPLLRISERINQRDIEKMLQLQADSLGHFSQEHIENMHASLDRMTGRWNLTNQSSTPWWEAEANSILQAYPVLQRLVITDPALTIKWEINREGPNNRLGQKLVETGRFLNEIELAKASRHHRVFSVEKSGTIAGYYYLNPIYNGKYEGVMFSYFTVDGLFDKIFSLVGQNVIRNNYAASIYDGDKLVYTNDNGVKSDAVDYSATAYFPVDNSRFRIVLGAPRISFDEKKSNFDQIWLIIGLLVLLCLSLYLALKALHAGNLFRLKSEDMQRQKTFLDTLLHNMPLGIFVKDVKKNFAYAVINKKAEDVFGMTHDQALGLTDYDFFSKNRSGFFPQNG